MLSSVEVKSVEHTCASKRFPPVFVTNVGGLGHAGCTQSFVLVRGSGPIQELDRPVLIAQPFSVTAAPVSAARRASTILATR